MTDGRSIISGHFDFDMPDGSPALAALEALAPGDRVKILLNDIPFYVTRYEPTDDGGFTLTLEEVL